MPVGPGGLDSNGIWQFGEDDSEALASDLLNLGMGSVSTAISTLGGVLQVVSTAKSDVFSTTSTSYTNVTGLSASITPSSTTSKILVLASVNASASTSNGFFRLLRDTTVIGSNALDFPSFGTVSPSYNAVSFVVLLNILDAPSTVSSVTYQVQAGVIQGSGTVFLNRRGTNDDNGGVSSVTLMEVAG